MKCCNPILLEDIKSIVAQNLPWEKLYNSHVLISGANGFLPAYMVEVLLFLNDNFNAGIKVTGLVRNKEKASRKFEHHIGRKDLVFIHQDLSIPFSFELTDPADYIIHAASQASPKFYGIDPVGTILPNVAGTKNLLDLAVKNQVKSFLYFSSGEVYGNVSDNQIPTSEKDYGYLDPTNIRSCYGESKRMGENICVSYFHQYGVPVKMVRPFHTYGPGVDLNDGRVFADFISDILHSRDIVLTSNGSATRAFCYLSDATLGFFYVLLAGMNGEAYNVGSDKEISILELAETLVKLFPEKHLKVIRKIGDKPEGYVKSTISRGCPKIEKAKDLGWSPYTSIEKGFYKTIKSYE